ncbi:SPW repeat protein [Amycolatopsis sp. NPDC052450]|uniref:SPW repeat protein n=1 Tax=Amycolatopsis sp. NPDC052450 TaxID=3363937 RepID=UPI0037CB105D
MAVRTTAREKGQEATHAREDAGGATGSSGFSIGLVLLAGVYLILSPWVIQFTGTFSIAATNMISGIVLALFATGCARSAGLRAVAWVIPVLGAWVLVSPWVISRGRGLVPLEYPGMPVLTTATWLSNVIAGAVVIAAGIALTTAGRRGPARS